MEQLYIIGCKYTGKKTIKRILTIVDNNDNNTCFKSKMWDITCIDVFNIKTLISSLKYITNYIQKNILIVIDSINYNKNLETLFYIFQICCRLNIYITICINKIDLLLYDYIQITKINNIINSYIHDISISYDLYKIVNISSIRYNNRYYNIFNNDDDELCLCESLIYSSFYTYKKRIYEIMYSIPVDKTIKIIINENYNKIICIINNYEYEAKIETQDDILDQNNQKNKPNEFIILKHFINIDCNNPIVVVYV